ncbi:Pyridoxamine 5'-phosphate oxidase [Paraoerskovia marina]|uniref:Pyridoxamine 5'-phosphate oxidase n=1 Tax=Paraoerskovia marina TaxID=545619 RepID=A0A1H1MT85_9CELL|nr:pyridoxamine 5'-phosphate oxidase [Paraoerskovia marina]SDR89615.1 Pyridoxamine 5'-phosphate oxidase [Paraoerskovia marina]
MSDQRTDYTGDGLAEADLEPTPLAQVRRWVDEARARQISQRDVPEPTALALATADADGPDVRTVLMRFLDGRGPGFVTNLDSTKGHQIAADARVAASLTWPSMFRSIRFRGVAEPLGRDEVTAYFDSRPWGSRVGAWASHQSAPVADRAALEEEFARWAAEYPDTGAEDDVPVPNRWGGWRIRCTSLELWSGRRNRLHDRLRFDLADTHDVAGSDLDDAAAWVMTRLQP